MEFKELVFKKDTNKPLGKHTQGVIAHVKISKELNIRVSFGADYYSNGVDTYDVMFIGDMVRNMPSDYTQHGYANRKEVEDIINSAFNGDFKRRQK